MGDGSPQEGVGRHPPFSVLLEESRQEGDEPEVESEGGCVVGQGLRKGIRGGEGLRGR